jgi:CRISPR-associated protein Csd2
MWEMQLLNTRLIWSLINMLTNTFDFSLLFDVINGNPNGDPDNDNMPRIMPNGYGLCTDTSIKYRVKTYINSLNKDKAHILGIRGNSIPVKIGEILKTVKNVKDDSAVLAAACEEFFDVRAFGAVLNWKNSEKEKGYNNCNGAVQVFDALSVHPINICSVGRTCAAIVDSNAKENSKGQGSIGPRHFLQYGLFRANGVVKPFHAQRNGFTEDDLQLLWEGFERGFRMSASASKGQMNLRGLVVFKHVGNGDAQALYGVCPDYVLQELVVAHPKVESPVKFEDFDVFVKKDCPVGIEVFQPASIKLAMK